MTKRRGSACGRFWASILLAPLCVAAFSCADPKSADVDRLLSHLDDEHWQVRASAAAALGRQGAVQAIPRVRTALTDESADVRAAAAMALGRLGARSALPDIRTRIWEDDDPEVVTQAMFALANIAGDDDSERQRDIDMLSDPSFAGWWGVDRAAKRALIKLEGREKLAAEIRAALRSPSDEERVRASRMATALDLSELSGWERDLVNDKNPKVRRNAYRVIVENVEPGDFAVLLTGLKDDSPAVRAQAAEGLEDLGDPAALPALEKAAGEDPDAEVRETSAGAIASMTGVPGSALPALWHFERVADRVALEGDGTCTLNRTFTLVVDGSPEPIRDLKLLLPRAFPEVDRVTDAQGNTLSFEFGWKRGLRQLELPVPPIERGVPATFSLQARSRRPVSTLGRGEAEVTYAPGPFQARVQALHVEFVWSSGGVRGLAPEDLRVQPEANGEAASFERAGVAPGDDKDLVLRVAVPASGLRLRDAPARSTSRGGALTTLAIVVASILGGLVATILLLRRKLGERADRAILVAALTTGALLFLTPTLVQDNLSYYAWARSAVMDGDLDRADEYTEFNQTQAFTPSNREVQDPIFASLFQTPFIAAAHGLTWVSNLVSPTHAPNGFSFPYLFLTALGDFFAVLVGCLACFSLVARRVGSRYALFGVLSVVVGTNLLLFAYAWTASSFQPSFFLFAVFLNHWDKTRDVRGRADWFVAGLLLGLLDMTRTLNLGFALIPLLDWSYGAAAQFRKAGLSGLAKETGLGALLASGMLLGYAPQLVAQRLVDQTFVVDAYGVGTSRFAGLRDQIGPLFFAVPEGLFSAMPLLALAFIGLVALFRFDRRLAAVLTATLALQLLAIGSYEIWWGRFAYGTPYLVPCTPIFCLGMASLMKVVDSRWRGVGRGLLWAATVLFAARNGWCVIRLLAPMLVGPWFTHMNFADLVHTLWLPARKLDVDILRPSSEFGCVVRELVGGLRAWDLSRLAGALGWASLVVLPILLVYAAAARTRRWLANVSRRTVLRFAVSAMALSWLATMGWIAALASRTKLDYLYQSERREAWERGFAIERLEPGESFSFWFGSANPCDRFSLITFLDGALDVPQGERVAEVELVGPETQSRYELRAGVDTADFTVNRPESRPVRGHTAPLDHACFSWRVGDDSSGLYTANAYRSVFTPVVATRPTVMKVTSLLKAGAIEVLVANSREQKLPQDRSRRRWVSEAR